MKFLLLIFLLAPVCFAGRVVVSNPNPHQMLVYIRLDDGVAAQYVDAVAVAPRSTLVLDLPNYDQVGADVYVDTADDGSYTQFVVGSWVGPFDSSAVLALAVIGGSGSSALLHGASGVSGASIWDMPAGTVEESYEVPVIGTVTTPAWAVDSPAMAVFFLGFATAAGIIIFRACLRWFKKADGVGIAD